ncbi:MAG: diaminopimelate epimerase [Candidatus Sericytochromatia bacterium]
MQFPFYKFEGLGNDFILLQRTDLPASCDLSALAQELCNRHFGIGADGLLIAHASAEADARMQVINADGSEPEMCGNGLRCFVAYLHQRSPAPKSPYHIATGAGILEVYYTPEKGLARVNMGPPRLGAQDLPALGFEKSPVLKETLEVAGRPFEVTLVSMGNPHCIIEVDQNWSSAETQFWGPQIENHPRFPQRTNVEFTLFETPQQAKISVWERGAGETLACGTGACATLVAGVLLGRLNRAAELHLPGGPLQICWDEMSNQLWMEGPARKVFSGSYEREGSSR